MLLALPTTARSTGGATACAGIGCTAWARSHAAASPALPQSSPLGSTEAHAATSWSRSPSLSASATSRGADAAAAASTLRSELPPARTAARPMQACASAVCCASRLPTATLSPCAPSNTPPTTRRPCTGSAEQISAAVAFVRASSVSTSAPTWPRSSESIFLKQSMGGWAGATRASAARAASASSARECVESACKPPASAGGSAFR